MSVMWLCPIDSMEPFVLGTERIQCLPNAELDAFRGEMKKIHPRLLMMFKANALFGEPAGSDFSADQAEGCGAGKVPFTLSENKPIRFDQPPYSLSSCANALLVRLLPQGEVRRLLDTMGSLPSTGQQKWLNTMQGWARQGKHVILIQEDQQI